MKQRRGEERNRLLLFFSYSLFFSFPFFFFLCCCSLPFFSHSKSSFKSDFSKAVIFILHILILVIIHLASTSTFHLLSSRHATCTSPRLASPRLPHLPHLPHHLPVSPYFLLGRREVGRSVARKRSGQTEKQPAKSSGDSKAK